MSESFASHEFNDEAEMVMLPPKFIESLLVEPEEEERCVHLVCKVFFVYI